MSKKPLLPALPLVMLTLVAPQVLQAQDENEPVSSSANMTLDTMVVTATRTEESIREVSVNTTVISEEKIKMSSAVTLDKLLEQQGFYIINNGVTKMLRIRGIGQGSHGNEMEANLLVLLDGRRIGASNIASFALDNVERIEVIRGPSAVQYGSSAMGGVVNIITRRGQADSPQASLELGFGSFDLYRGSLGFSGGGAGFDFSGGLTHYGRDDYKVDGNEWRHTGLDSATTMNMNLGYNFLEKHRLGLSFYYSDQNDAEFPDGGWIGSSKGTGKAATWNSYDMKTYNTAFSYEGSTEDERLSWFARYSFGSDEKKGDFANSLWGGYQNDTMDTKAATAQVDYNGGLWALALGLDYLNYDFTRKSNYGPTKSEHENLAGYFTGKLRLMDEQLILTAGGRFDHFSLGGSEIGSSKENHFSPSVGLAFLPVDWLKLRANYSEGFKMPSPYQLGGGRAGSSIYLPSPGLDPEESNTFELGFDIARDYWDFNLTYFQTDWKNKIYNQSMGASRYKAFNMNKAEISGLETAFSFDLGQALGQNFTLKPYVSLTSLFKRENKDKLAIANNGGYSMLFDTPKLSASYGLDFVHPDYDFKANINAAYYGEQMTTDWTKADFITIFTPEYKKHSGGTVVDLSLEKGLYTFENCSTLSLKLDVNNLFDADNDPYFDYPGPGRNFYVGLRYEYK